MIFMIYFFGDFEHRDSYKKDSYKKRCMLDVVMRCINHTQNMQLSNIKYI